MNPVRVALSIQQNKHVTLSVQQNNQMVTLGFKETIIKGGGDYQKLKNLPSINGTELFDNYDEIDPTVPKWAKESTKPSYTAQEIGAIDENSEMSFTSVKEIWDSVFNKGG